MSMGRFLLSIVIGISVTGLSSALEVRITPNAPIASSEVSVTVCGWTPATNYQIYDTDLRVEGADIWLDLYWQALGVGGSMMTPYEHTESLGTFAPGTYTVHVTNKGVLSDSGTATFTVNPDVQLSIGLADLGGPGLGLGGSGLGLGGSGLGLDGSGIEQVPWPDASTTEGSILQLRVNPPAPTSSDQVSVTITGWKPSSDIVVERTTLRTEENEIWLDIYWHTQPLLPPAPSPGAAGMNQSPWGTGFGLPSTVIQSEITPYWSVPFEHIEHLGTFSPGTYVLHVTNYGPVSGSASTSFTVSRAASVGEQPLLWWFLLNDAK